MSGLVIAFGPAIGPTLAGFILNLLGWRYLFILILPIMVLIWIIGYFVFPNYSEPLDIKIDYLSVVLSLLGSSLANGINLCTKCQSCKQYDCWYDSFTRCNS